MHDDFDRELARVVDRLRTMPLTKLTAAADAAYGTATLLLHRTPGVPQHLPRIADHAAGDQLAVIGQDFRGLVDDEAAVAEATAALIELRRTLP